MLLVLNSQFVSPYHFRPNSGEGKPYLVVDQDQQYKITLKIEGKADLTANLQVQYLPSTSTNRVTLFSLSFCSP